MLLDFNPAEIEITNGTYQIVEPGKYKVVITEIITGEDGELINGKSFGMKFTIIQDGKWKNRYVAEFFTVVNKNPITVSIAREKIAKIARAINMVNEKNVNKYIGKQLIIEVSTKPDFRDDSNIVNDIKDYLPISSNEPDHLQNKTPAPQNAYQSMVPDEIPF